MYSTAAMANVYIPPEIQENVFSYLMHSSAKGLAFKWKIQESWFKVSFQRLQRALATNSRETYHRELVRLFQDIDQLPNLTDETRIKFHKEITGLHFAFMFDLNSSRLWRVTWSFFSQHASDQLLRDNLKEHFMTGYISEGGTYFGYLLLNREMHGYEVMHLLGSPYSSSLFELEVNKLHIKPANELSLHWSRFDNIKEENRGLVSFGNWQLFEKQAAGEKITLQYSTPYSRYLLCY